MKYYVLKCSVCETSFREESYGIMLVQNGKKEYFCDISNNFDDVKILVDRLNEFHIESCHLQSVIEDFKYETEG